MASDAGGEWGARWRGSPLPAGKLATGTVRICCVRLVRHKSKAGKWLSPADPILWRGDNLFTMSRVEGEAAVRRCVRELDPAPSANPAPPRGS